MFPPVKQGLSGYPMIVGQTHMKPCWLKETLMSHDDLSTLEHMDIFIEHATLAVSSA